MTVTIAEKETQDISQTIKEASNNSARASKQAASQQALSSEKIWYKSYPEGVAHQVDPNQYPSMTHFLEETLKANADRPFSVCMERWMSYKQLDQASAALAAWLQAQGLPSGTRVAIMLPNIPQFIVSMIGVLRAGFTCVNVNPLYTPRELEHQLRDSGSTVIIILENFAHTLQAVIDRVAIQKVVVTGMGDLLGGLYGHWINFAVKKIAKLVPAYKIENTSHRIVTNFSSVVSAGRNLNLHPHNCNHDSIAFLQYTGGTTGVSKGAILTHRNILSATMQACEWFEPSTNRVGDPRKLNNIAALPLYHIFALTLCLMAIRQGSYMTLIPNPRDVKKFIEALSKRPFHFFPAVNTLFNALLNHPDFKKLDFSHLCISQAGGMATSEGTAKRWKDLTGCPIIEGWGMSETCAMGTDNPVNNTEFTGTIGLPLSGIDIVIKDDEENTLPLGQAGEICIKGPNVMIGYYNQPEETKSAFTRDGYLRTGDIGDMDERGHIRIIDRKKDMILVSGFNVYPNEVENVVSLCEGVVECAAIGIPDEKQGESIKLFVVKNKSELTEADIKKHCHENLTGYKCPKFIEFRDELPKTNVGKILRRQLKVNS